MKIKSMLIPISVFLFGFLAKAQNLNHDSITECGQHAVYHDNGGSGQELILSKDALNNRICYLKACSDQSIYV